MNSNKVIAILLVLFLVLIGACVGFFTPPKPEDYTPEDYKQYGKTKSQIKLYLNNIMGNWGHGTNTATGGVLYKTYNNKDRMDIYDNSLLANLLMTVNETNTPNPITINILNIFQGRYDYLQSNDNTDDAKLIAAAFSQHGSELLPVGWVEGVGWDSEANAQDVGNNSMVGISLAKFCLKYKSDPNTPNYKRSLTYLLNIFLTVMKCPNNNGIYRRWPIAGMNISMEHMIDAYALGVMCKNIGIEGANNLMKITSGFVSNPLYFVDNTHYGIGTLSGCDGPNNIGVGQPFDTQTWNMLSGADNVESKKNSSLKWVIDNGYNSDKIGVGISFALPGYNNKGCSHYENTGSLLAALNEYRYFFGKELSLSDDQNGKVVSIYKFVKEKIDNNEKIQAAYTEGGMIGYYGCETADFPGCCSYIASGWKYPLTAHLGATVYCAFALLSVTTPANPYKFY